MASEYVRLSATEKVYSKKNLLQAQLDLISLIKRLENYKAIRSEELLLKISLKNKIEELKNLIALLEKLLPKTSFMEEKHFAETKEKKKERKRRLSLEEEVEEIRRKIAALNQ
jgi:hypothetical protein